MGSVLLRLGLALLLIAFAIGAALYRDQISAAALSSGIGALGVWGSAYCAVGWSVGMRTSCPSKIESPSDE
jgi:hypothetical protein